MAARRALQPGLLMCSLNVKGPNGQAVQGGSRSKAIAKDVSSRFASKYCRRGPVGDAAMPCSFGRVTRGRLVVMC